MRKFVVALVLVAALGGCSHLDFGLESSEPEWGNEETAGTAPPAAPSHPMDQVMAAWDARAGQSEGDYRIGPGDELSVSIFALEQPGVTTTLSRTVSGDGRITLPWVQGVAVQDLTVPQAEQAVGAAYAGRYLQDPQVTVNVTDYASSTVVVTGAVNKPGIYALKHNLATVLECLSLAGGPTNEAGNELTLVHQPRAAAAGEPRTAPQDAEANAVRIDLQELLGGGNQLLNLPVSGGDVITIAPNVDQYIYVLGYVRHAGAFKLDAMQKMDALSAVALGGGLANTARAANSFLVRQTPEGQRAIPVNLDKVARGEVPPLYMSAGDTLVVGTGFGGRVAEVFSPSMGANVSASASVMP